MGSQFSAELWRRRNGIRVQSVCIQTWAVHETLCKSQQASWQGRRARTTSRLPSAGIRPSVKTLTGGQPCRPGWPCPARPCPLGPSAARVACGFCPAVELLLPTPPTSMNLIYRHHSSATVLRPSAASPACATLPQLPGDWVLTAMCPVQLNLLWTLDLHLPVTNPGRRRAAAPTTRPAPPPVPPPPRWGACRRSGAYCCCWYRGYPAYSLSGLTMEVPRIRPAGWGANQPSEIRG